MVPGVAREREPRAGSPARPPSVGRVANVVTYSGAPTFTYDRTIGEALIVPAGHAFVVTDLQAHASPGEPCSVTLELGSHRFVDLAFDGPMYQASYRAGFVITAGPVPAHIASYSGCGAQVSLAMQGYFVDGDGLAADTAPSL